jgi:cell division protein FtsI (penicillin-binding protein 3)
VDDLSVALSKKFPDRTAAQYKNVIMNGWSMREKEERQIRENQEKGIDKRVSIRSRYVRILRKRYLLCRFKGDPYLSVLEPAL